MADIFLRIAQLDLIINNFRLRVERTIVEKGNERNGNIGQYKMLKRILTNVGRSYVSIMEQQTHSKEKEKEEIAKSVARISFQESVQRETSIIVLR